MTDQPDPKAQTLRVALRDLRHSASPQASPVRVGRSADADVQIGDDAVAEEHLRLTAEHGTWTAVDRSGGQTYTVDGEAVERVSVSEDRMRLRLGAADGPEIGLVVDSAPVAPAQRAGSRPQRAPARASGLRGRFLALTGPWSRRRIVTLVAVSVLAASVAYMLNVWLVGGHYDGTANVPSDATVASSFNDRGEWAADAQGMLFWFLVAALAAALVTQLVIFGPMALFQKAIALPARLRSFPSRVGAQWPVALAFGLAVGLVLGSLVIPASRAVVGLGVLIFLPFALGGIVIALVSRASMSLLPSVVRRVDDPDALSGTWLIGTALGLLLAAIITSTALRLGLAIVIVAFAVLRLQGRIPTGAVFFVVPAAIAIDWLVSASSAFAHDGGFVECQIGVEKSDVPGLGWLIDLVDDTAEYLGSEDCAGVEDAKNAGENAIPPAAAGASTGSAAGGKPPDKALPSLFKEPNEPEEPPPPIFIPPVDPNAEIEEPEAEAEQEPIPPTEDERPKPPRADKTPPGYVPPPWWRGPVPELQDPESFPRSVEAPQPRLESEWQDPGGGRNTIEEWPDGTSVWMHEGSPTERGTPSDPPFLRTTHPDGSIETQWPHGAPPHQGYPQGTQRTVETPRADGGYDIETFGNPDDPDGPSRLLSRSSHIGDHPVSYTDYMGGASE